jgi:hypothetical protein
MACVIMRNRPFAGRVTIYRTLKGSFKPQVMELTEDEFTDALGDYLGSTPPRVHESQPKTMKFQRASPA